MESHNLFIQEGVHYTEPKRIGQESQAHPPARPATGDLRVLVALGRLLVLPITCRANSICSDVRIVCTIIEAQIIGIVEASEADQHVQREAGHPTLTINSFTSIGSRTFLYDQRGRYPNFGV